ncbi:hypothetical protein ABZV78_06640 [Micromonospora sp. NPDC004540]|uniref:hypothetical protein n=1 Tax=Micromonospora sp. NPDC004540 TaxID=3154457 RepID=UPI0033A4B0B5
MLVSEIVTFLLEYRLFVLDATGVVVEANMAWFSTSYAANPDQVLDVVLRAAGPRHRLAPRDHAFTRPPTPFG